MPLRWKLLQCMAREYPDKMAGIGEIWAALSPQLDDSEGIYRSMLISATSMGIYRNQKPAF